MCEGIELGHVRRRFPMPPGFLPLAAALLDPEADGAGAAQDLGGPRRQRKPAMTGNIGQNDALSDQLAVNRKPAPAVQFSAHAESP